MDKEDINCEADEKVNKSEYDGNMKKIFLI